MATLLHELWVESDQEQTFCLAGPMGDDARALMAPGAQQVWSVTAGSHFEAMTKYYEHMGWGTYATEHNWDYEPYPEEWLRVQRSGL
jgi:hypothetical protein